MIKVDVTFKGGQIQTFEFGDWATRKDIKRLIAIGADFFQIGIVQWYYIHPNI